MFRDARIGLNAVIIDIYWYLENILLTKSADISKIKKEGNVIYSLCKPVKLRDKVMYVYLRTYLTEFRKSEGESALPTYHHLWKVLKWSILKSLNNLNILDKIFKLID